MTRDEQARFTHAVVMGDLVESETAASVPVLHAAFNAAVDAVNRRGAATLASPLTITLGDEFQGLARSLSQGLTVVRDLRRTLRAENVACRFVLGLVELKTPLNAEKAWNMMGPGLARARERLADKRDANAFRFSLPADAVTETLLDAIGAAITGVEARWTERQFTIVAESLAATVPDAAQAARLGIKPRTLYKIRRAAELDLYKREWTAVETALADLDQRYGLA